MDNKKVMVAGHICVDITPLFGENLQGSFDQILSPGKLVNTEGLAMSTGGVVSNTGLSMSKLGIDVLMNGKVGNDHLGRIMKDILGPEKAIAFSTVAGQQTSYSVVLALPGIDRVFLHFPGTNDTFTADDIDYEAVKDCSLFHFGYPPLMKKMYENQGAELAEMFKRVKELGVVTSLDMTLPDPSSESGKVDWQIILKKTLCNVDVFTPSVEEISYMLDGKLFQQRKKEAGGDDPVLFYLPEDYTGLTETIFEYGCLITVIKSGINGLYLRTADKNKLSKGAISDIINTDQWSGRCLWAPSFKAEKFGSATGAGDSTIAGFLTSIVKGFGPAEALNIANTVGWENVRCVDALSGVEDWEATLDYMEDKNRPRNELELEKYKWKWSDELEVYVSPKDNS